jgi:hypothetical protein
MEAPGKACVVIGLRSDIECRSKQRCGRKCDRKAEQGVAERADDGVRIEKSC